MENIFLKSIKDDLDKFEESALELLKVEYCPGGDERLPAKYRVALSFTPWEGTPAGKNILNSLEYFSPALWAYACFKASKNEINKDAAKCYFDAGISHFQEWHDRKESVLLYQAFMRANTDRALQLTIIKAKLSDDKVTGYALERDNVAPKKTAEKVIRQLKKYLNQE